MLHHQKEVSLTQALRSFQPCCSGPAEALRLSEIAQSCLRCNPSPRPMHTGACPISQVVEQDWWHQRPPGCSWTSCCPVCSRKQHGWCIMVLLPGRVRLQRWSVKLQDQNPSKPLHVGPTAKLAKRPHPGRRSIAAGAAMHGRIWAARCWMLAPGCPVQAENHQVVSHDIITSACDQPLLLEAWV